MNRKLLNVLASICVACVLIIILEWFYALWAQKQALKSTDAKQTELALDELPVIDLLSQPEEIYADLVTRPLFINGRRPVNEALPDEALEAAKLVVKDFDWRLNGIYSTPNGLSALLSSSKAKATKSIHRKITIGAELDGWKLTEIHKDRIVLEQNNQPKELLLQKPKAKNLAIKPNTPLANGIPPEIPNIPPPPQAPNPFNTPNSPEPPVDGTENIDNE